MGGPDCYNFTDIGLLQAVRELVNTTYQHKTRLENISTNTDNNFNDDVNTLTGLEGRDREIL